MERTITGVAAAQGLTARLRFIDEGNAPTVNDKALTERSLPSLYRVFGKEGVVPIRPLMVAEDLSVYAHKVPSLLLILGTRNRARGIESVNHTPTFDIDEAALPLGVRTLATLALDFLGTPKPGAR
jgi:amidohydrolase